MSKRRLINYTILLIEIILLSCNENTISDDLNRKKYYSNGKLKSEVPIKNKMKNGLANFYFENGSIEQSVNYENDVQNGKATFYYSNGNLKAEGYFKNGLQFGEFKFYNQNGKLEETQDFQLVKEKIYLNQYKKYGKNGELLNHLSNYVSINCPDTMCLNNVDSLEIRLEASVYKDKIRVITGGFDENYSVKDPGKTDTIDGSNNKALLFPKFDNTGEVFLRGIVQDYKIEKYKDSTLVKRRNIFFSKKLFIKEC